MARSLTFDMDEISNGNASKRQPAYKVEVWDVRRGVNTVADIVTGASVALETGPFDVSEFTSKITIQERSGDYATTGIPSTIVTGTFEDPGDQFNPDDVITDPDALGRFFRRGNVIRVTLGDERLAESEWVEVFTGLFAGQCAYKSTRAPGTIARVDFKAYGREATFLPFERTSNEFVVGQPYIDIAVEIARDEMGLSTGEIGFLGTTILSNLLRHNSVTLAKENPMAMLSKVMFFDGLLPRFDGSGILTTTSGLVTAASNRFYDTDDSILSIERPLTEIQPADRVCVVGLDFNLSRIDQPRQLIAQVSLTTGYFTSDEDILAFWSDDKTKRADKVEFVVNQSVNGGFSVLGGGEKFEFIASPTENSGDSSVGTIGIQITISTGYAPWVAVFLVGGYVALSALPNEIIGFGIGAISGFTINIGGIIAATSLAAGLFLMTKIGRGQYDLFGEPFEFVFKEIRECAAVTGVGEFESNQIEIANHLIDNAVTAANRARDVLLRQQARSRPRNVRMMHDLKLEPDDIFESLTTGRRFLINTISYTLERASDSNGQATLNVYEITDNISRAT